MKKVFALLLVFVMLLSAVPVLAEGEPQIESVVLPNDPSYPRVSIELENLSQTDKGSIEVALYSGEQLLTKVRLNPSKLSEFADSTVLTCCIPFTGADECWPQDPVFKPQINVVADKAVLYVGGQQVHEMRCDDLDRTTWNAMVPITSGDLYVTNEVKLSREITPKAYENPKDTYLVNSTYGNYVSYTATMDMTKLEGSPLMNELANQMQDNGNQVPFNEGMWSILRRFYDSLSAEVTMTFTFDPMIDLSNYDTANITLDSNMFRIKDDGIQVSGSTITINCEFDPTLRGDKDINPIITLHGNNLPIKSSWNGDYVTLVNQGAFSGKVTRKVQQMQQQQMLQQPMLQQQMLQIEGQAATYDDALVQQMQQQQMQQIIGMLITDGLTIKKTTVRDSFTLYIDHPYYPPYNPTPVQPVQPTQPGILPPPTGDMPLWYAIVHFLGLA